MGNEIIVAAIAACGGAVVAVVGQLIMWVVSRNAAKHDRRSEIADGVMFLLQDRIKYLAKHYIAGAEISAEDLEDLLRMHEVYHKLGGNGYLDTLICAVKNLPIITKED